jgi:hypothetical protein
MSIYYFIKQRFPRKEKRSELRTIFEQNGNIPNEILHDDKYFTNFRLSLSQKLPDMPNKFKGLNYVTLGDYKTSFDLRPIRNVIVKQNLPEDDSSIYEIFSRLNSGGINLRPQEIRISLYHSDFYDMLYRINTLPEWRRILARPEPDIHMKDIEILLRGFAMLVDRENYAPSMIKFLNQFSKKSQNHSDDQNQYLEGLFESFLASCVELPDNAFLNKHSRRFNIALYEAVFTATCTKAFEERRLINGKLDKNEIRKLEVDEQFSEASQKATTQTSNVKIRLNRALEIITPL